MRITILAVGTQGDVQPYIALGLGLQAAGDTVRIATHAGFESLVRSRGLDFAPVSPDPRAIVESNTGKSWRDSYHNGLLYVHGLRKLAARVMHERVTSSWQACQGSDAIVASGLGLLSGYHIAEKLKVPLIRAFTVPATPTRAYPANFVPPALRLGGRVNRLTHQFTLQLFWLLLRGQANAARRAVLDLPPLPVREPFGAMDRAGAPVLYGYSPAFAPPPSDWGDAHQVTGYWFLNHVSAWQPPDALLDFLAAGPPPVYVGFGSMTNQNAGEIAQMVVAALERTGARGVLLTGWGGLDTVKTADNIYTLQSAPHEWLFPQMALAVHHGGAGTVATSLCAGVPMIVIPFLPDHLFWGQRVHALGIGPRPIMRRQLSVERLAGAIATALRDPGMKARAAALGQRVRGEDGVGRAVDAIHAYL